jgi:hypothetical protein
MFSNLGFSVSKFCGVIHHSWRYPTPRVPLGHHTWGIADVILGGQSPTTSTSFILTLCSRWYSFIHLHSELLPHHHSYAKDASKRRILSYTTAVSPIVPSSAGAQTARDRLYPDRPKPSPPAALQASRPLSDLR